VLIFARKYWRKNKHGLHIKFTHRAEHAANFLAQNIWGGEYVHEEFSMEPILCSNLAFDVGPITLKELREVIKKFKRRKAPGPDNVPIEVFKEMDDVNLERILDILNSWWTQEEVPEDLLQSRVVLIFKKGDAGDMSNYRPISLLTSLYKIFASILQRRIAEKLDPFL